MKPATKKKAKFYLQLYDAVWSVPLAMLAFVAFGVFIQYVFSNADDPQGTPGIYDPSFLQSMVFATCVQVFLNGVVWIGIYFNFRRVTHYHSGRMDAEGNITNQSKDDFQSLQPWQRLCVLFFLYCFLSVEWVVIWLHLK